MDTHTGLTEMVVKTPFVVSAFTFVSGDIVHPLVLRTPPPPPLNLAYLGRAKEKHGEVHARPG